MPVHHVDIGDQPITLPTGMPAPGSAVWFEIRPGLTRSAVIADDILTGLGKRRDVAGVGRNAHADIALTITWLRAYDVTALVATEAQRLSPLVLKALVALARRATVPLWLLHRPPRSDAFFRQLGKHQAHPMRPGDIPTPRADDSPPALRPTLGIQLPPTVFHTFLTRTREALTIDEFQQLQERHIHTYRTCSQVLDRAGTGDDVIARLVTQITAGGPTDDLLVTDIRALQLAAWHHDTYLKMDLPTLLASPERPHHPADHIDQLLVAYRQPHRTVAVSLATHQTGIAEMAALRPTDITDDGILTDPGGDPYPLGPNARRAVRALRLLRQAQTDDPTAPLLGVPDKSHLPRPQRRPPRPRHHRPRPPRRTARTPPPGGSAPSA